jgi:hypothetical protein
MWFMVWVWFIKVKNRQSRRRQASMARIDVRAPATATEKRPLSPIFAPTIVWADDVVGQFSKSLVNADIGLAAMSVLGPKIAVPG